MTTLTIDEVQAQLPQLIDRLQPGEEVVITRADKPVAKLIRSALPKPTPVFGSHRGMLTILDVSGAEPKPIGNTQGHQSGVLGVLRVVLAQPDERVLS